MAVLNDWQKITRVLPGQPFGSGADGSLTVSSTQTQSVANSSCSGSASSTTLTLGAASTFSNGDVVVIHQTRGTGVTQWEINRISSGAGSTTLTLQETLHYDYTDSGASQAQVFELKMYSSVTVNGSVTLNGTDWGGNVGGFISFAAKSGTTITGTVDHQGADNPNTAQEISGGGFEGAYGKQYPGSGTERGRQGEGTGGAGSESTSANGNGGGGGQQASQPDGNTGAGGGHASAGGAGSTESGQPAATGGSAVGSADLTTLSLGGGGGGGIKESGFSGAGGGSGGGAVLIFTSTLTVTGSITVDGGNGASPSGSVAMAGGGGAGGSVLVVCQTATLGTNLITALGGAGGNASGILGGNGSVGRIAVHHSSTVTGTTNPSFFDQSDGTLVEGTAAFLFNML